MKPRLNIMATDSSKAREISRWLESEESDWKSSARLYVFYDSSRIKDVFFVRGPRDEESLFQDKRPGCFIEQSRCSWEDVFAQEHPDLLVIGGFPNSTKPRLPPRTIEERLSLLGDEAEEIANMWNNSKYTEALRSLGLLNDSIRTVVLSGELDEPTSNTLDPLLSSLESCKQIIYNGIRSGGLAQSPTQAQTRLFLESVGRTLKALAAPEEWLARMVEEWGGNGS